MWIVKKKVKIIETHSRKVVVRGNWENLVKVYKTFSYMMHKVWASNVNCITIVDDTVLYNLLSVESFHSISVYRLITTHTLNILQLCQIIPQQSQSKMKTKNWVPYPRVIYCIKFGESHFWGICWGNSGLFTKSSQPALVHVTIPLQSLCLSSDTWPVLGEFPLFRSPF